MAKTHRKKCAGKTCQAGKIHTSDDGSVWALCSVCGHRLTLKKTSLAEVDALSLSEIKMADGEENNLPQTKTILIPREKLCRKCSAQLFPVFPEIKMGEKILYDCGGCGEREYR